MNKLLATFSYFWYKFHHVNKVRKIDKSRCENLCNIIIDDNKKWDAIINIKSKLSAYEYLKTKLLNYGTNNI